MRTLICMLVIGPLAACSGGGDGGAVTPPVSNQSPGGIWEGIDANGDQIIALVTETGRLHVVDEDGTQGFGNVSVANGNDISGDFTLVAELGSTLLDGSAFADCTLDGTGSERTSLSITIDCTTGNGTMDTDTLSLTYNNLYARDSSLATIAGQYDDSGAVLNVSSTGVVDEQDPVTGCVINGQVSIINASWNAYDVEWSYASCLGQFAALNGATFTGIGTLDNTVTPELVFVGATGDVQGVTVAILTVIPRI